MTLRHSCNNTQCRTHDAHARLTVNMEPNAELFVVTVRARKRKSLQLPAAHGAITYLSGTVVRDIHSCAQLKPGVTVDVLLNTDTVLRLTEGFELDFERGGCCLRDYRLTCERTEIECNQRGAVVLCARFYHGTRISSPSSDSEDEANDLTIHKEDKDERAAVFAVWLIATFGKEVLRGGGGVLDIAAGQGALSAELCSRLNDGADNSEAHGGEHGAGCGAPSSRRLRSTLVEPAPRGKQLECVASDVSLMAESFDESFPARWPELCSSCSMLVGLHPDQPTEAIVDVALALGKPFAIVPCCVFQSVFPSRRQVTGQHVRGYAGFLRYLKAKDHRIESANLPFQGRNRVLFCRSS